MATTTTQNQTVSWTSRLNPWMIALAAAAILTGQWGWTATTSNADPTDPTYDPTAAAAGPPLLIAAGVLLAGLLVAGAIGWQLRHR